MDYEFGLNYLYFTGFGLESPWITVWIQIVIYLTGLGLENTWTTNLDYDY